MRDPAIDAGRLCPPCPERHCTNAESRTIKPSLPDKWKAKADGRERPRLWRAGDNWKYFTTPELSSLCGRFR
jgi:hypothetical protein